MEDDSNFLNGQGDNQRGPGGGLPPNYVLPQILGGPPPNNYVLPQILGGPPPATTTTLPEEGGGDNEFIEGGGDIIHPVQFVVDEDGREGMVGAEGFVVFDDEIFLEQTEWMTRPGVNKENEENVMDDHHRHHRRHDQI
jgi:hypothetical protein